MRAPCPACGRDADLSPVLSVLDHRIRNLCLTCSTNNAEPKQVVVNTSNWEGWPLISREVKSAVRVFDIEEYVTLKHWAERMSARMPAIVEEEDEEAAALVHRMEAVRRLPENIPPPKRGHWFWLILTHLGLCRELTA